MVLICGSAEGAGVAARCCKPVMAGAALDSGGAGGVSGWGGTAGAITGAGTEGPDAAGDTV